MNQLAVQLQRPSIVLDPVGQNDEVMRCDLGKMKEGKRIWEACVVNWLWRWLSEVKRCIVTDIPNSECTDWIIGWLDLANIALMMWKKWNGELSEGMEALWGQEQRAAWDCIYWKLQFIWKGIRLFIQVNCSWKNKKENLFEGFKLTPTEQSQSLTFKRN